jgi:hypothetical protein
MLDRELEDLLRQARSVEMARRRNPDDARLRDKEVLLKVAIESRRELLNEGRNR